VARPALGVFNHEAAAVDPVRKHVYLTEDKPDGRLYRFRPTAYPSLASGTLEVATVAAGSVAWSPVPDPRATLTPTRYQVPTSTAFNGGEGAWYADGSLWFTTKGDNRLWELAVATGALSVVYDASRFSNPVLTGVDNIVRAANGDLFVCEDGGDLQLVILSPDGDVWPFLQVTGQPGSELAGAAFDPSGSRLYFSSQRGPTGAGPGVTYEVRGPFRRP
jgi:secreted PhoX family phosphatase